MGPEELDDLLASIRAEGNKERSALALYKGTRGTDLVNESIDERIVNILGLGQVFDIDYATYLTLLKEKLVQVSMGGGSLAREEQMLLQDEFKRVKGKVGRFKINRRTANVGAISGSTPLKVSKDKFFLTSSAVIPENPGVAKVSEDLKGIHEALDKILAEIKADNAEEKKQAELERRQKIRNRRVAREKLLERSQKKISNVVSKVFKPVTGILDRIFRFLFFGLLGNAFKSFIGWFSDPANKDKVSAMFGFIENFWPAILGGLALFFTPLGGFVRGILGILTFFGPKLFGLIAKYPLVFGALAVTGAAVEGVRRSRNATQDILKEKGMEDATPKEQADELSKPFNLLDIFTRTIVPPREEKPETTESPVQAQAGGGKIYNIGNYFGRPIERASGKITSTTGTKIKGAGPDTQLIAAQPGEFIISKNAVNTYGSQFFMNLNKEGGGTNIPNFVNNIQFAQGGGVVGGMVGSPTSQKMSGGLMGLPTSIMGVSKGDVSDNVRFDDRLPMSPEPSRKISLPAKALMMISDKKSSDSSETSLDTQMSSGVSMNTTAPAAVRYNDNMMSPVQRITLPPEPPVRSKKPNMTVLPEIVRNSAPQMQASSSNSSVPSFSPSQSNDTRQLNFAVYGIEGMN